ncbi:MAG: hypothetical protein H6551_03340 [Chitinophagales bacterium]|nr:hypothetical protein [Chitinophagaceae bacterium]MCB9064159.1 hypothetical protein [Chitinophagales bacterium]
MKYLVTIIISTLAFINTEAQTFSAGARTGLGYNVDLSRVGAKDIGGYSTDQFTWDKELYARVETNKRIAVEARFTHYKLSDSYIYPENIGDIMVSPTIQFTYWDSKSTTNVIVGGISAQVDLTCPYMQDHCPMLKNIRNYIGFDVAGTYAREVINQENTDPTYQVAPRKYDDKYYFMQYGISHTIIYQVSPSLNINTALRAMIQPSEFSSYTYSPSNTHISGVFGVGYTF